MFAGEGLKGTLQFCFIIVVILLTLFCCRAEAFEDKKVVVYYLEENVYLVDGLIYEQTILDWYAATFIHFKAVAQCHCVDTEPVWLVVTNDYPVDGYKNGIYLFYTCTERMAENGNDNSLRGKGES